MTEGAWYHLCCGTRAQAADGFSLRVPSHVAVAAKFRLEFPVDTSCFPQGKFARWNDTLCQVQQGRASNVSVPIGQALQQCAKEAKCWGVQLDDAGLMPATARLLLGPIGKCGVHEGELAFVKEVAPEGCVAVVAAYHKTGNVLMDHILPTLFGQLFNRHAVQVKWFSQMQGTALAPFAYVPVGGSGMWQPRPSVEMMERHLGWHPFCRPVYPVLIQLSEDLPNMVDGVPARRNAYDTCPFDGGEVAKVTGGRLLHMIRPPSLLVASALRYHVKPQLRESGHFHAFHALRCGSCSVDAWHRIFRLCGYRCSWFELIDQTAAQSVEAALELQFIRSHAQLQSMISNLVRFSNNSKVLHLSPEHFADARAMDSVRCLARFLSGSVYTDEWRWSSRAHPERHRRFGEFAADSAALDRVAKEVVWKYKKYPRDDHRSAHDERWIGLDLRGAILRHPRWGQAIRRVEELMRSIFARQARMYGCPHVDV